MREESELGVLDGAAKEYALAEYQSLRQEIKDRIERIESQRRYGIFSAGGFWAWYLSAGTYSEVVWLPAIFTLFFLLNWQQQHRAIIYTSSYIREQIEQRFGLPEGLGWESTWTENRLSFVFLTGAFWVLLLLGNVVAAIGETFGWAC